MVTRPEDVIATVNLIGEVELRGAVRALHPVDLYTAPRHLTGEKKGVPEIRQMTPLRWQLVMKFRKMSLRPGRQSWWGPAAWRIGSVLFSLTKLTS
jgi:hypothetical protein